MCFGCSGLGVQCSSSRPSDFVVDQIKRNGGEAVANYDSVVLLSICIYIYIYASVYTYIYACTNMYIYIFIYIYIYICTLYLYTDETAFDVIRRFFEGDRGFIRCHLISFDSIICPCLALLSKARAENADLNPEEANSRWTRTFDDAWRSRRRTRWLSLRYKDNLCDDAVAIHDSVQHVYIHGDHGSQRVVSGLHSHPAG